MMVERMCRIMNELKSLRLKSHLTQKEAADRIGVSLRSYVSYENEVSRIGTPKYRFLLSEIPDIIQYAANCLMRIEVLRQVPFKAGNIVYVFISVIICPLIAYPAFVRFQITIKMFVKERSKILGNIVFLDRNLSTAHFCGIINLVCVGPVNNPCGQKPEIGRTIMTVNNADFSFIDIPADNLKTQLFDPDENLIRAQPVC